MVTILTFSYFQITDRLIRPHKNPPPDYAAFISVSFDVWTRCVAWASSRKDKYSPDIQELFDFFNRFRRVLPLKKPLYSYLVDNSDDSDEFGQDLVSYRHHQLQKLVPMGCKGEEAL